jgi:hypothetical protein
MPSVPSIQDRMIWLIAVSYQYFRLKIGWAVEHPYTKPICDRFLDLLTTIFKGDL